MNASNENKATGKKLNLVSCRHCPKRHNTEWCQLTDDELTEFDYALNSRIYHPGEVLYHQGDEPHGLFCIHDGLIGERRVDSEGNSLLVRLSHPATTLGYREFLTKTPYSNTAEVLRESRICYINKAAVSSVLKSNPSLSQQFLKRSLTDLQKTEDNYVVAMNASVRDRLLHLLLVLYERYGSIKEDGGYALEIPIARNDLASLIGTGPETISRTIRRLQKEKLVTFDGRMAYFDDLEAVYDEIALVA